MSETANQQTMFPPAGAVLPDVSQLLSQGGDQRIEMKPNGVNAYGFSPVAIGLDVLEFSASTSSTLSLPAFERLQDLRAELIEARASAPDDQVYQDRAERLRDRLLDSLGLAGRRHQRPEVILSPSGTDVHQIAAQLHALSDPRPTTIIMIDPVETGSGVYDALKRGAPQAQIVTVALRQPDTRLRTDEAVQADIEALLVQSIRQGRRILLVAVVGSKTGLVAPGADWLASLTRRYPLDLSVLLDACQMRHMPSFLGKALGEGYFVAVSGSKFLSGPAFSAALLVPVDRAVSLKRNPLIGSGVASTLRQDWPKDWATERLPSGANFGLLLRWEAALSELAAFHALDGYWKAQFYAALAEAVQAVLADSAVLSPVEIGSGADAQTEEAWDQSPTIFPFTVRAAAGSGRDYLSIEALKALHMQLMQAQPDGTAGVRLGQPVVCGHDAHGPIAALRLAASARLAVAASLYGADHVIDAAVAALRRVEAMARP